MCGSSTAYLFPHIVYNVSGSFIGDFFLHRDLPGDVCVFTLIALVLLYVTLLLLYRAPQAQTENTIGTAISTRPLKAT